MLLLDPRLVSRVGRSGFFFFLFSSKSVSFPELYRFLVWACSPEKEPLSATIVIIDGNEALVNQCNEGYDSTSELQTLEALQNVFILIYRCEIFPYYVYILFTWKSKWSRGCDNIFLISVTLKNKCKQLRY